MKNVIKKFNNIAEYEKYLSGGTTQEAFVFHECSATGSKQFTGTNSYDDANERLLKGDKELAAKINKEGKIEEVRRNLFATAQRRQTYSSVVGCAPNVPAFVAGAPNSMIAQRSVNVRQKVFNIIYSKDVAVSVDACDIVRVGANLLRAILQIEASGARVNLWVTEISGEKNMGKKNSQFVGQFIKVKDSGQPLDILNVAYPIASPSFTRRHFFRFVEVTPTVSSSFRSGYGKPRVDIKDVKVILKEIGLSDGCFIRYSSICNLSIDNIANLIKRGGDVR